MNTKIIQDSTQEKHKIDNLWYDYDEFFAQILDLDNSNINQSDLQRYINALNRISDNLKNIHSSISELTNDIKLLQYNDSHYNYYIVRPDNNSELYMGLCSGFTDLEYIWENYDDAFTGIQSLVKKYINYLYSENELMPSPHILDHIISKELICGHCSSEINGSDIMTMQKCLKCERMVCDHVEEPDYSVGIWGGPCIEIICVE